VIDVSGGQQRRSIGDRSDAVDGRNSICQGPLTGWVGCFPRAAVGPDCSASTAEAAHGYHHCARRLHRHRYWARKSSISSALALTAGLRLTSAIGPTNVLDPPYGKRYCFRSGGRGSPRRFRTKGMSWIVGSTQPKDCTGTFCTNLVVQVPAACSRKVT